MGSDVQPRSFSTWVKPAGQDDQLLRKKGNALEWHTPTTSANIEADTIELKAGNAYGVILKYDEADTYEIKLPAIPSHPNMLLSTKSFYEVESEESHVGLVTEWVSDITVNSITIPTSQAGTDSIAFKYWGNTDYKINLPNKPNKIDEVLAVKSITNKDVELEWKDAPTSTAPTTYTPPTRDYAKFYTKNYKEVRLRLDNIYTEAVIDVDDHGHLEVIPNSDSATITLDSLKNDNTTKIHDKIKALLDINKLEYEYNDVTSLTFANKAIEGQRYLIIYTDQTLTQGSVSPSYSRIPLITEYRFKSATEVEVWRYTVSRQTITEKANQPTTEDYATFKTATKDHRLPVSQANILEYAFIVQSDTDRKIVQHDMELHEIQLFDIVARKSTFSTEDFFQMPYYNATAYSRVRVVYGFQYYNRNFGGNIGVKEGFIFAAVTRAAHPAELYYVELSKNAPTPYKIFTSGWLTKYSGPPFKIYSFAIDSHEGKDYIVRHFSNQISHYEIYWDSANNKLAVATKESKLITISAIYGAVNKPFVISSGLTQDNRWTIIGESGDNDAHTFEVDKSGNVFNYTTLRQSSNQLGPVCIVNFASGYQLMTKSSAKIYKITTTTLGTIEVNLEDSFEGIYGNNIKYIAKHPKEKYVWLATVRGDETRIHLLKSDDGWRTAKRVEIREHFIQLPASDFFKIHGFRD